MMDIGAASATRRRKKWLLIGAELGDRVARRNIAIQYYWGNHLFEKNERQAVSYMKLAADAGDIEACKWMAKFYRTISWMEDPEKAKKYENMTIAEEDRKKKELPLKYFLSEKISFAAETDGFGFLVLIPSEVNNSRSGGFSLTAITLRPSSLPVVTMTVWPNSIMAWPKQPASALSCFRPLTRL